MRLVDIILLFLALTLAFIPKARGKVYYFSSSMGDDHRTNDQAENPLTPWKSIKKLNSIIPVLLAGDSILFRRGDVFYGRVIISRSGSAASPLVFSAYGRGPMPIITGFTAIRSWKISRVNIWESDSCISTLNHCNIVVINGINTPMGRYPNSGYLTYIWHKKKGVLTSNELPHSINWTGAQIVLRKNHYIIDRLIVTEQPDATTLKFLTHDNYMPHDGFGFFIENDCKTLDTSNEWYYNPLTKSIKMFSYTRPTNVDISTLDTLLIMSNQRNVTFDSISFTGSNETTFIADASSHINLIHCRFIFSGTNAIKVVNSSYININNCFFNNTNNNALTIGGDSNSYNDTVTNHILLKEDTIRNTAVLAGMGKNEDDQTDKVAVFIVGSDNIIEKCIIDSTGYIPVWFRGNSFLAKNNFVTKFCFVKDDGAAFWTWNNGYSAKSYTNQRIFNNIILNGIGAPNGSRYDRLVGASGIYCDTKSSNVEIMGNVVAYCCNYGILLHNAFNIVVKSNTLYDNGSQIAIYSDKVPTHDATGIAFIRNVDIEKNILLPVKAEQQALNCLTTFNDLERFGTIDYNYYIHRTTDSLIFQLDRNGGGTRFINYSPAQWRKTYQFDTHSWIVRFVDPGNLLFEYNANDDKRSTILKDSYTDITEKIYSGRITLKPFTSIILIKSIKE